MKLPGVSVCVPTYNGSKHLAECIDSVLAQTYRDFEVVICDDQSSDGTLELARQLAGGDPRFRFIANPRRFGLVGNWNNCVGQARGEWIKFVFQDDVIMPACIESLLMACREGKKPFGFCDREFIFDNGVSDPMRAWFIGHQEAVQSKYGGGPVVSAEQAARAALSVFDDQRYNPVGEPTVTLIKKSLFDELGSFDNALIHLCDAEFWYRIMVNHGAAFVAGTLAKFRIHEGAATAANHQKRQFRMATLDPLVLCYRFAFGRHFEPARNPAVTHKSILAQKMACAVRASDAYRQARNGRKSGDDSLFREWKTLTSQCAGLQAIAYLGWAIQIRQRLTRSIKRKPGREPIH